MMTLLEEVQRFVTNLYDDFIPESYEYHNLQHTKEVVHYVGIIGQEEGVSDEALETLQLAAWFHDTGFSVDKHDHELHSAKIARDFLKNKISADRMAQIERCILATRLPQTPLDKLSEILCDADMYHLSDESNFILKSEKFRQEQKLVFNQQPDDRSFWVKTGYFLDIHQYFTSYAQTALASGKEYNRLQVQEQIDNIDKKQKKKEKNLQKEVDKLEKKLQKLQMPSRGIETMFRLTARNQINLSAIADNKANILISLNTIIISIVVTMLVSKFTTYPHVLVPSVCLLTTSLVTMIFGVLSTRPNIKSGRFTPEDVKEKRVNLLFFGNFYRMTLEDYDAAIKEMMKDYDGLYGNMIKDQYFLGKVLGKKYKLLRIAYTIFMFGITISVIIFGIFVYISNS
jgi:predicted metal-dependent HD superfamily phosphohydrolase